MRQRNQLALAIPTATENPDQWLQRQIASVNAMSEQTLAVELAVVEQKRRAALPAPKRTTITGSLTPSEYESVVVTKLFRQYGFPVFCDFREPGAITMTPRHILYLLDHETVFDMDALKSRIEKGMGRDIRKESRKGKGPKVSVSIIEGADTYLQVSRAQPAEHLWAERDYIMSPITAHFGSWWEGTEQQEVAINMYGPGTDLANGFICGQPGAGKTHMLRLSLLDLLMRETPETLHVYAIETKAAAFECLRGLPGVTVVSNADSVMEIIDEVLYMCSSEGRPRDGVHRLLVVDEVHMLLLNKGFGSDFLDAIYQIMSLGRESGIRVWLATQVPNIKYMPPDLKALCAFTIAGYIKRDSYLRNQLFIRGASQLVPKHEAVIDFEGDQRVFTMFRTRDGEFEAALSALFEMRGAVQIGGANTGAKGGAVGVSTGAKVGPTGAKSGANTGAALVQGVSTRVLTGSGVKFPLDQIRALTNDEAIEAYRLHAGGLSKNRVIGAVFGVSKNSKNYRYVNEAIQRGGELDG